MTSRSMRGEGVINSQVYPRGAAGRVVTAASKGVKKIATIPLRSGTLTGSWVVGGTCYTYQ